MDRPEILEKVINTAKQCKTLGKPALKAIFDIDSTLFDVSPRIVEILKSFGKIPEMRAAHPEASEQLLKLVPHPKDYGVKRTLMRVNFQVPSQEFIKILVDYWKLRFFSNEYLHLDIPYPGSVKFVNDLYNAGADIIYLTGRDVPRMLQGTLESLKRNGFPVEKDHANVRLKPSTDIGDGEFKRQFFKEMEKSPSEVWFFENEPVNISLVLDVAPHVKVVFLDTAHSGKGPEPGAHISRIQHF